MKTYFLPFLRQHRAAALAFTAFAAIFAAVFSLYDLQTEPVLYAALLSALLGIILLAVGFYRFCRRRKRFAALLRNPAAQIGALPEPETPEEADCAALVNGLYRQLRGELDALQAEQQENVEYFTAWVHQIKIPIAVMRMELQGEDTPEHRALLNELFRIEQYAEMALCQQRLASESNDLVLKDIPVDRVIREVVRKFAPLLVRQRIRLTYTPTGETALTDEKWLGFMLEQLLSNAAKYAAGGEVKIACENGVLSVSDTGVGIAPEELPRIFEKGFTGVNGRSEGRATGLGLYLCRRAAKLLGHTVRAESAPGAGTSFRIDLRREWLETE